VSFLRFATILLLLGVLFDFGLTQLDSLRLFMSYILAYEFHQRLASLSNIIFSREPSLTKLLTLVRDRMSRLEDSQKWLA
jgi:hypothetical protein